MALDQAGVELIAKGAGEYVDAMGRARDAQGRFVAGIKEAEATTGGGGGSLSTMGMAAANFIGTMAVQAFNAAKDAAAEFVGSTITVAADYESTMNRFKAVTGDAIEQSGMKVEDFNALFLDMGAKTQYSAQQAADAAVNLAKGGMDPATIAAGGLEGALALAAAGELDLAQAAEITAKTLGVWGDRGVDAAMAANLMSQAANASTVDVDDLAIGLANVGGTAKTAGVTFQDTVQAMALLAPGFSSASDAGTSFKTFLSRMIPTTDKQTEAMIDLGLATEDGKSVFFDAQGQFIGMKDAAQKLQDATAGLTQEQKLSYLNMIFGQDAIRAAAMLAEAGAEGFDAMGVAMGNAGSAADQAAARNQGLNFALESLKGSWETIQIVVGTALLPVLTEFLNTAIIPLANAVLSLAQQNMPALTGALSALRDGVAPLVEQLGILGDYFFGVEEKGGKAKDALAGIPEPIQPIITATKDLMAAFQESIPTIQTYINDMKGTLETAAARTGELLGTNLTQTLDTAAQFWRDHSDEVMAIMNGLWRVLVAVGSTMLIVLSATVNIGLTVIDGLFDAFEAARDGKWTTFWDGINDTADTSFDTLMVNFTGWLDTMIRTFSGGTQQLDDNWKKSLLSLRTNLENTQVILNIKVAQMLTSLYYTALANIGQFVSVGEQIVRGMILGVTNIAGELGRAAAQAALGALEAAKGAIGIHSPSTAFEKQVGEMAGEGFIKGLENMQSEMGRAAGAIFGGTVGTASASVRGSMAGSSTSYSTTRQYNLNVNTQQSLGSIRSDFGVMQLLAG